MHVHTFTNTPRAINIENSTLLTSCLIDTKLYQVVTTLKAQGNCRRLVAITFKTYTKYVILQWLLHLKCW